MTAPLFDDDPARDAELIARHQQHDPVDACIAYVHDRLVAAALWDLGDRDARTDDAADESMQQLRDHLLTLAPQVLVEALLLSRWDPAYEQAVALHAEMRRDINLYEARMVADPLPRRRPADDRAVGTAAVPEQCQDPDGHAVEHVDVVGWLRHLKATGLCARCGRICKRGQAE